MKRCLCVILILFVLTGCRENHSQMNQAISLREAIANSESCTFSVVLTADYYDVYYNFTMHCTCDAQGNVTFEVAEPETIAGITGKISNDGGQLTFDDQVLVFPMIAEGIITPVSAPWLFINALRGGYISGCGNDDDGLHIVIQDTYADDTLRVDIFTGKEDVPDYVEIYWKNSRVISMDVEDFCIL